MTTHLPIPSSFIRPDLEAAGFVGWNTWDALREAEYPVPPKSLCYVVYRPSSAAPKFLDVNPGGHFKGQDPTVPVEVLAAKWVAGAHAVNIGKADAGFTRLKAYARFGAGEPVPHWGGRYIWQLADSHELLCAWHVIAWPETARDYEKRLLNSPVLAGPLERYTTLQLAGGKSCRLLTPSPLQVRLSREEGRAPPYVYKDD